MLSLNCFYLFQHMLTPIPGLAKVVVTEILDPSILSALSVSYDSSDIYHARRRMQREKPTTA